MNHPKASLESNATIERRYRKSHKSGLCPFCPPKGGENARRQPAHGEQKPRYKDHR